MNNRDWQELQSSNGSFYFYRAFYDTRKREEKFGRTIRILGMVDRLENGGKQKKISDILV